jgi:hypothetical protein
MTSRQVRRERREAERKGRKAELKRLKAAGLDPGFVSQELPPATGFVPQNTTSATQSGDFVSQNAAPSTKRTEINRLNAEHSTGPRTRQGKLASSRNSLKHGLASGELIIPGEDRTAFEALLHDLLDEHQPANATERLLVTAMAQSWWLAHRAIRLQNDCFNENGIDEKRLSLFLRYQTTHDRALHKALSTLIRLQKERRNLGCGFVSQNATSMPSQIGFVSQNAPSEDPESRFVSQKRAGNRSPDQLEAARAA